jgi:hypothetical protein
MKADEWENDPDRRGFYWRFAALRAGLRREEGIFFCAFTARFRFANPRLKPWTTSAALARVGQNAQVMP